MKTILKRNFAWRLDPRDVERLRRIAQNVPGCTQTSLLEEGIRSVAKKYERAHNGGKPFEEAPVVTAEVGA
jgi:hypothetical protein